MKCISSPLGISMFSLKWGSSSHFSWIYILLYNKRIKNIHEGTAIIHMWGSDGVLEFVPNQCLALCAFFGLCLNFPSLEIIGYTWDPFFNCPPLKPFDTCLHLECVKNAGSAFCDHLHQQFYSSGCKLGVPNVILTGFILGNISWWCILYIRMKSESGPLDFLFSPTLPISNLANSDALRRLRWG